MSIVQSALLSTEEIKDMLETRIGIEQTPDRFCVNCKWSKHSSTSTPLATDVRCFNPKVIQADPGYAVLGPLFSGVNCINQRGSVGTCGKSGIYYESDSIYPVDPAPNEPNS